MYGHTWMEPAQEVARRGGAPIPAPSFSVVPPLDLMRYTPDVTLDENIHEVDPELPPPPSCLSVDDPAFCGEVITAIGITHLHSVFGQPSACLTRPPSEPDEDDDFGPYPDKSRASKGKGRARASGTSSACLGYHSDTRHAASPPRMVRVDGQNALAVIGSVAVRMRTSICYTNIAYSQCRAQHDAFPAPSRTGMRRPLYASFAGGASRVLRAWLATGTTVPLRLWEMFSEAPSEAIMSPAVCVRFILYWLALF